MADHCKYAVYSLSFESFASTFVKLKIKTQTWTYQPTHNAYELPNSSNAHNFLQELLLLEVKKKEK